MKASSRNSIKTFIAGVDWNLLVFLLLFMNVKLVVKLAGLLFIYWRRQEFSFGFSIKGSRFPLI
ncbi:MAG: hypothetical protein JWQ78_60 [Sediminibacterium sp.]|nr:hypothetical protein [Sediminibacterium sp.]